MFTADNPMVGFHLDLKYVMPNKQYLCGQWLEELAAVGINTLLVEYEDKFPYQRHPVVQSPEAFTPDELKGFLSKARSLGITPIPLVQTLAHLEFALAHDELAHLREMPDIHTHICPSNPEALQLVHDLIEEVLEYHKDDPYFHLGADEAHFTGTCDKCKPKLEKLGKVGYWADHLTQFFDKIRAAGQRSMVWDDIFWPQPSSIHDTNMPKDVILHCWDYAIRRNIETGEFRTFAPSSTSNEFGSAEKVEVFRERVAQYQKGGYDILGAPCMNWGVLIPMHDHNIENTAAWAEMIREKNGLGVINTAWQSFHTPLPTYWTNMAATTAVVKQQTDNWESQFHKDWFGVDVPGFEEALENIGLMWEQPLPDLNRPIAPILYSYMDLVLWWPTFPMRSKRGGYPLDKSQIDFADLHRRKTYCLTSAAKEDRDGFETFMRDRRERYAKAAVTLNALAEQATKHRDEANLLALFGQVKHVCADVAILDTFGEGDRDALKQRVEALYKPLQEQLDKYIEPPSRDFLISAWWKPAAVSVGAQPDN